MSIPESSYWHNGGGKGEEKGRFGASVSRISKDWVLVACILLTGALCFGLGMLVARDNPRPGDSLWIEQLPKEELTGSLSSSSTSGVGEQVSGSARERPGVPFSQELPTQAAAAVNAVSAITKTGSYVASKTGTKYYLPTCATAKRIKEENKVWFATKQEAENAGYAAASNCKGL